MIFRQVLSGPLDAHYLQHYPVNLEQLLQGVSEQIHMVGICGEHMLAAKQEKQYLSPCANEIFQNHHYVHKMNTQFEYTFKNYDKEELSKHHSIK